MKYLPISCAQDKTNFQEHAANIFCSQTVSKYPIGYLMFLFLGSSLTSKLTHYNYLMKTENLLQPNIWAVSSKNRFKSPIVSLKIKENKRKVVFWQRRHSPDQVLAFCCSDDRPEPKSPNKKQNRPKSLFKNELFYKKC